MLRCIDQLENSLQSMEDLVSGASMRGKLAQEYHNAAAGRLVGFRTRLSRLVRMLGAGRATIMSTSSHRQSRRPGRPFERVASPSAAAATAPVERRVFSHRVMAAPDAR
jgi:hypothetical protein